MGSCLVKLLGFSDQFLVVLTIQLPINFDDRNVNVSLRLLDRHVHGSPPMNRIARLYVSLSSVSQKSSFSGSTYCRCSSCNLYISACSMSISLTSAKAFSQTSSSARL